VDVAYDGPTALELVAKKTYGLALIDYRMPGMDGVELYRRIRQMRPDVVGVFVTGFPTIDTVYPAIAVGVERVIAKPAGSNELLQVIEEFVGKPR
jgi:CheY-like chemotaxis protein